MVLHHYMTTSPSLRSNTLQLAATPRSGCKHSSIFTRVYKGGGCKSIFLDHGPGTRLKTRSVSLWTVPAALAPTCGAISALLRYTRSPLFGVIRPKVQRSFLLRGPMAAPLLCSLILGSNSFCDRSARSAKLSSRWPKASCRYNKI